mgnify:CR=1 FL=1
MCVEGGGRCVMCGGVQHQIRLHEVAAEVMLSGPTGQMLSAVPSSRKSVKYPANSSSLWSLGNIFVF